MNLVPSATQDDRIPSLEAQIAFLAERLNIPPEELALHSSKPVPSEVPDLVAGGHEVEAIHAYRQAPGASLKAAKAVVDGLR